MNQNEVFLDPKFVLRKRKGISFTINKSSSNDNPARVYLVIVNDRNARTRCEICSKITTKIPKRRHWRHISHHENSTRFLSEGFCYNFPHDAFPTPFYKDGWRGILTQKTINLLYKLF